MRSGIIALFLFILFPLRADAQTKLEFTPEFQIYGGRSVPVGVFGSATDDYAGYATGGFGVGADLMMVTDKNVAVVGSVHYSRYPIDGEALLSNNDWPAGYRMDERSYVSTYLLVGARWNIPLPGPVRPFLMGQGGVLFAEFPGYVLTDNVESFVYSSSSASTMALSLSAGARLFGSVDLSVRYQQGNPEFESDVSYTWFNGLIIASGKLPFRSLLFVVGYVF